MLCFETTGALRAVSYLSVSTKRFKYQHVVQCCMQCKHCNEEYNSLQKHVVDEHLTDSKKLLYCDNCDKPYVKYSYRISDGSNCCSRKCTNSYKRNGLDTECAECGNDVYVPPSHVKEVDGYEQKNHFCDKRCESSYKSREWVGENHPSWQGGKVKEYCEECGEQIMVIQSAQNSRRFCSYKCMGKSQSVEKEPFDCVNCGKTVMKMAHNVKCENTTCSKECFKEFMSSIRKAEGNPCWKGGRFEYYGPNWQEQREKALERDEYKCQECEITLDEHVQEYNEELHVHHIEPRRKMIDEEEPTIEQFELANSLDNLVTVCKSCHRKLESE